MASNYRGLASLLKGSSPINNTDVVNASLGDSNPNIDLIGRTALSAMNQRNSSSDQMMMMMQALAAQQQQAQAGPSYGDERRAAVLNALKLAPEPANFLSGYTPPAPVPTAAQLLGMGVDMGQERAYGGLATLGDLIGNEELKKWALQRAALQQEDIAQYPQRSVSTFDDARLGENMGQWLKESVLTNVPEMAGRMAPAIAATVAGGPVAGIATGIAAGLPFDVGGQYLQNVEQMGEDNAKPVQALLGGAAVSAVEMLPWGASGSLIKAFTKSGVREGAARAITKGRKAFTDYLLGLTGVSAGEGGEELIQTAISEGIRNYNDGKNPLDYSADQYNQMYESAVTGAAVGAVVGGPSSVVNTARHRSNQKKLSAIESELEARRQNIIDNGATRNYGTTSGNTGLTGLNTPTPGVQPGAPTPFDSSPDSFLTPPSDFGSLDNNFLGRFGGNQSTSTPSTSTPFDNSPDNLLSYDPFKLAEGKLKVLDRSLSALNNNDAGRAKTQQEAAKAYQERAKLDKERVAIAQEIAKLEEQQQKAALGLRDQSKASKQSDIDWFSNYRIRQDKAARDARISAKREQRETLAVEREKLNLQSKLVEQQRKFREQLEGPKLNATEQKEQQRKAQADAIAQQTLQNTASVLDPSLAQQQQPLIPPPINDVANQATATSPTLEQEFNYAANAARGPSDPRATGMANYKEALRRQRIANLNAKRGTSVTQFEQDRANTVNPDASALAQNLQALTQQGTGQVAPTTDLDQQMARYLASNRMQPNPNSNIGRTVEPATPEMTPKQLAAALKKAESELKSVREKVLKESKSKGKVSEETTGRLASALENYERLQTLSQKGVSGIGGEVQVNPTQPDVSPAPSAKQEVKEKVKRKGVNPLPTSNNGNIDTKGKSVTVYSVQPATTNSLSEVTPNPSNMVEPLGVYSTTSTDYLKKYIKQTYEGIRAGAYRVFKATVNFPRGIQALNGEAKIADQGKGLIEALSHIGIENYKEMTGQEFYDTLVERVRTQHNVQDNAQQVASAILAKNGVPGFTTSKDSITLPKNHANYIAFDTGAYSNEQVIHDSSINGSAEDSPLFSRWAVPSSPHKFYNFVMDYIGTGEGGSVHGWGIYVLREDAKWGTRENRRKFNEETYRLRQLSRRNWDYVNNLESAREFASFDSVSDSALREAFKSTVESAEKLWDTETVISSLRSDLARGNLEKYDVLSLPYDLQLKFAVGRAIHYLSGTTLYDQNGKKYSLSTVDSALDQVEQEFGFSPEIMGEAEWKLRDTRPAGQVFDLEIPDAKYMLNLELPINKQSLFVRERLRSILGDFNTNLTGRDFQNKLTNDFGYNTNDDSVRELNSNLRMLSVKLRYAYKRGLIGDEIGTKALAEIEPTLMRADVLGVTASTPTDVLLDEIDEILYNLEIRSLDYDRTAPMHVSLKLAELGIQGYDYTGTRDGKGSVLFSPEAIKILNAAYRLSTQANLPPADTTLPGLTQAKLENVVNTLNNNASNGVVTRVVQSMDQLPADIQEAANGEVEGVFDPRTNQVWFVADNITSEARAAEVWVHEQIVHGGLRGLLSLQERVDVLNKLYQELGGSSNSLVQEVARAYGYTDLDTNEVARTKVAEEVLARFAERRANNLLTQKEQTLWDKVVQFVQDLFNRAVSGITGNQSDASTSNVDALLSDLGKYVMEGLPASSRTENSAPLFSKADTEMTWVDRRTMDFNNVRNQFMDMAPDTKELLLEGIVDCMRPVQKFIKDLHTNGSVTVKSNIAKMMEALPNSTSAKMKSAYIAYVEPITDAYAEYARKYGVKNELVTGEISEFLEAQAALERNQRFQQLNPKLDPDKVIAGGMSSSQARAIMDKYSGRDMSKFTELYQKLHNYRLDLLEQNHIFDKEVLDAWRGAYQYYMPLRGWNDAVTEIAPAWAKSNVRKSLSTPTAQEKMAERVHGRQSRANDPTFNAIKQMYDAIQLVQKAEVQRGLLQLVEDNPDSAMVRLVKEGRKELGNKRTIKFDLETGEATFPYKRSDVKNSENVISCIDNEGNIRRVEFADERVAKALKGENVAVAGQVIETVGALQNKMKELMTAKSPLFWMVNPIRDYFTATLNMYSLESELKNLNVPGAGKIAKALLENGAKDFFSMFTGNKTGVRAALHYYYKTGDASLAGVNQSTRDYMKDFSKFIDYGGQSTYYSDTTFNLIKKDLESALKIKNPQNSQQKAYSALKNMGALMNEISDSLENKTRYVVFQEIVNEVRNASRVREGVYQKADGTELTDDEILRRAASAALNITVNFSQKGAWAPIFNNLYVFASANISGNARMLETIFRKSPDGTVDWANAMKFAAIPMLGYAALSTLARALMGDDDDGINFYDKIPGHVKDNSFVFANPLGGNSYLTVPCAYGFNIFLTIGRNIYDALYSAATGAPGPSFSDAAWSSVGSIFDNFSTVGQPSEGWNMLIPSVIRPIFQIESNKAFTGNPIMPEGTNAFKGVEIPDSERYWSTANPAVVALCRGLNELTGGSAIKSGWASVSPETLEHLQTSYLGGFGKIIFGMLGRVTDMFDGKPLDASKIPGVSTFFKEVTPGDTATLYTKYRTQIQLAVNETELGKTNKNLSLDERMELIEGNRDLYRLKHTLDTFQKKLNDARHNQRLLDNSNASTESKFAKKQELDQQKEQIMKQFIKKVHPVIAEQ